MKTVEEMIEVMQAHQDGKPIEVSRHGYDEWFVQTHCRWDWHNCDYRVAIPKPSIDWSHVHPDFKWLATNSTGQSYLYTSLPACGSHIWLADAGCVAATVRTFRTFREGECNWKDSLVERPNGV